MRQLFVDLRKTSGTSVVASAAGAEYSLEGDDWQNGVFTYYVLQGLKEKKADPDRNGIIMLSELLAFVQQKVPEATQGKQTPAFRLENLVNDIRIW